jgi:hypothetical protein
MQRIMVMALCVVLALVVASPMAFGQVGQGAAASGKAGELAADWWKWALSKPAAENPLIGGDPDYSEDQCDGQSATDMPGKKWFLAGTLDGSQVERTCTVPVGKQLFFPVGNIVFLITEPGETEEVARQFVNGFMDGRASRPRLQHGRYGRREGNRERANTALGFSSLHRHGPRGWSFASGFIRRGCRWALGSAAAVVERRTHDPLRDKCSERRLLAGEHLPPNCGIGTRRTGGSSKSRVPA